jgi:hypothetical protein
MSTDHAASPAGQTSRLTRFAPGLASLLRYRRGHLPHDLIAVLPVAAVALPVGVAYAQLAGFNPAAKNRYDINGDKEMAALGAANIAAGLSQSFATAGADSRTVMSATVRARRANICTQASSCRSGNRPDRTEPGILTSLRGLRRFRPEQAR